MADDEMALAFGTANGGTALISWCVRSATEADIGTVAVATFY
jgi:hypothetical protein